MTKKIFKKINLIYIFLNKLKTNRRNKDCYVRKQEVHLPVAKFHFLTTNKKINRTCIRS